MQMVLLWFGLIKRSLTIETEPKINLIYNFLNGRPNRITSKPNQSGPNDKMHDLIQFG